jgi:hypothetical protein
MATTRSVGLSFIAALIVAVASGCAAVRPWQRARLASPALQFEMAPYADAQRDSILEITEGGTFSSVGPGSAGAGCGCH